MRFIPAMGSLTQSLDSSSVLHRSQFIWTDAKYLGDLIWKIPGHHLSELGEVGKPPHLTAYGLDGRGVPIMIDGRPINDPYTGTLNLYDIPLEAIEQIEPLNNLEGLLYGGQTSALNLVTRQFNNTRPVTNIRYLQGAFEYSLLDGFFAQNIARSTNALLGFQRQVTDGRFANSALDSWNIRGRLRYNATERFNLALTNSYSRSVNGMNGGIDPVQSRDPFDEITAVVRNPQATQRVSRYDISLNGIARPFRDSLSATQFSLYYSDIEREENNPPQNISATSGSTELGGRIIQNLRSRTLHTTIGFDIQRTEMTNNTLVISDPVLTTALFGKSELKVFELFSPSAAMRAERRGSRTRLSYGIGVQGALGTFLAYSASVARTYQLPLSLEPDRSDTTFPFIAFPERQQTTKSLSIEFALRDLGSMELRGFETEVPEDGHAHPVDRPSLLASRETTIRGITGLLMLRWWKFEGTTTAMFLETRQASLPKWTLTSEFSYRNVFSTIAELRAGIRARYASRHRGVQYVPSAGVYGESSGPDIAAFSRVDVFAVAKIGDAFLSLGWENLLNEKYVTVTGYPMPGRTFRLGVNWLFID